VNASSSWPTATGEDAEQNQARRPGDRTLTTTIRTWPSPDANTANYSNGERGPNLREAAEWPTPDAGQYGSTTNQDGTRNPLLGQFASRWPTVTVSDAGFEDTARNGIRGNHNLSLPFAVERWATPAARDGKGAYSQASQAMTPRALLPDQAKTWNTPRASDAMGESASRGADSIQLREREIRTPIGPRAPETETPGGGCLNTDPTSRRRLNPLFVEWLMGWPLGWTDFAPVGMEWSRWQRRMRSALSRLSS